MSELILVDNDKTINKLHSDLILSNFKNIQVTSFTNGTELLDYIFSYGRYRNRKFIQPLHILIDLDMRVMNGIDTLHAIQKKDEILFRELRISVLSSHVSLTKEVSIHRLSMINFIEKPLKLDILNNLLEINPN